MIYKSIIVEGADQQGKSTLCALLKEELGWDIVHYGKPGPDFDFKDDYIIAENVISDRNFYSEIVYSNVKGEHHRIKDLGYVIEKLKENKVLVLYVDRFHFFEFDYERHEEYKKEQILEARDIYRSIFLAGFPGLHSIPVTITGNFKESSRFKDIINFIKFGNYGNY